MIRDIVAISVAVLLQIPLAGQTIQPEPGESTASYLSRVRSIAYSGMRGTEADGSDSTEMALVPPSKDRAGTVSVAQLHHQIPKPARQAFKRAGDLARRGDADGALRELEKTVALDPEWAAAHNDTGVQYARRADYQKAEAEFRKTVELAPESVLARINLALIQVQLGNPVEAERNLRRAVQIAPLDTTARLLLNRLISGESQ
jgi:Flp pilus assembly protein TadD